MIVRVNDCDLYFTDTGGEIPLIAVHGGMGIDAGTLRVPPLTALSSHGIRVIIPDLRGHGRSACADVRTLTHEQWVHDLRSLSEALALDRFALLGHSYGGFLALEFALRWPELLTHLVLVSTSPGPRHVPFTPMSDESLRAFFAERWPRFFAGDEKHWPVFEQLQFSSAAYNAAYKHELPRYDVRDRVEALTMPTLLVVGSDDWYLEDMTWLADHIPMSTLRVIDAGGHLAFLDQPQPFARTVVEFLKS